ncbi:DUF3054 domain-containing protein [Gordonia shandongensis]|uniref:DUF3054 domain-containing protein n=1 Tax=Gordonia shandongensis TaxID=376351 RepID=UPI00047A5619|nr:DUF3054 domain-containing protein [Gordonia shandongensis]
MTAPAPASPATRRYVLPALADVIAIGVFVAVGRTTHDEGNAVVGFLTTAWPFLVGGGVGWLAVFAVGRGRRFVPAAPVPAGVVIWPATVIVGMLLRTASGQGTAAAFVIVAAVATGLLLVGWRIAAHLIATHLIGGRR